MISVWEFSKVAPSVNSPQHEDYSTFFENCVGSFSPPPRQKESCVTSLSTDGVAKRGRPKFNLRPGRGLNPGVSSEQSEIYLTALTSPTCVRQPCLVSKEKGCIIKVQRILRCFMLFIYFFFFFRFVWITAKYLYHVWNNQTVQNCVWTIRSSCWALLTLKAPKILYP